MGNDALDECQKMVSGFKIMVAGVGPFLLTVSAIIIWHMIAVAAYNASGSHESFMGPGLLLIYGFPYFIAMIIAGILSAIAGMSSK